MIYSISQPFDNILEDEGKDADTYDFNSPEELFAAMKEMPEDLEIFRAFQKTRPTNWDEGKYGAWCPRGAASRFFEISATPETSSTFLQ